MISMKIEAQDKIYPVCQITVGGVTYQSRSSTIYYIKPLAIVENLKKSVTNVLLFFQK